MAFEAKYEGECNSCDEDIVIGELIQYRGNAVEHVTCPAEQEIARAKAARARPICPRCFLTIPCFCE